MLICEIEACLWENSDETQIKLAKDAMLICEIEACL